MHYEGVAMFAVQDYDMSLLLFTCLYHHECCVERFICLCIMIRLNIVVFVYDVYLEF